MNVFKMNEKELKEKDCIFTATEIAQEPKTWAKTIAQIKQLKPEIQKFVDSVIKQEDYDVVLTGAGSSEFVGNAIFSYLNTKLNYKCKSYATTDIVETPANYLSKDKPTLLVSFGRSGNSPESMAAINVANIHCHNLKHLIITCNPDGAMSKDGRKNPNAYVIDLTPETCDKAFAMTSSYTNMYLAALLALTLDEIDENEKAFNEVIACAQNFIDKDYKLVYEIVNNFKYNRLVYLGPNGLKGIAQESSLKTLELCAGAVATMFDTPMGFRHGPKSIVNHETLTVVYVSDDSYQRQYDRDIIRELSQEKVGKLVAICSYEDEEIKSYVDYFYSYNMPHRQNTVFLGLLYLTFGQTLGLLKSLEIGNTPDNPSKSGTVSRVVHGVYIYEYKE